MYDFIFSTSLMYSKLEEASIQAEHTQCKDNAKSISSQPQLRLHELRVEKYNGLVRLLKPGCRTIILLVDAQSRLKLLPAFHRAVWPYRYVLSSFLLQLVFVLHNNYTASCFIYQH